MAIYKDKKRGTYYVSVYVELNNGDRKRILKRGFRTRPEAQKAEAEIIFNAAIENPDNPLFSDVVDEYISWYKKRRKESSLHRLEKECRLYIKPFFGHRHIQDIKKRDIMKFHDFLLDKLSITTSKNVHGFLSAIFNYAIKMEYIKLNVAREVGNIQASNDKKMAYWTIDEFKEFLKVVDNFRDKSLYMSLFYSGARIGELTALTWKDIDFNSSTFDINKTVYLNKIITTPKTKSSIRIIKMPNHVMNMLRQMKLQQSPKDDYYVFGEYYTVYPIETVNRRFLNYMRSTKVNEIRMHDFRHSHASYLINNGYDIQIVSKRLGHAKISTTYDKYAHLYPNKEEEAIEHMNNDFKPADIIKLIK